MKYTINDLHGATIVGNHNTYELKIGNEKGKLDYIAEDGEVYRNWASLHDINMWLEDGTYKKIIQKKKHYEVYI